MAISPHGGELVNRLLTGSDLEGMRERASGLPKLKIDAYASFYIDGIAKGLFSPLT